MLEEKLTALPATPPFLEREATRHAQDAYLSDDSDVAPPVASRVGLRSYSQQLEDYITRFRCRPPDIKFWPYGPYWPRYYEGFILDTPRFIRDIPSYDEPMLLRLREEDESSRTVDNQVTPYNGRWRGVIVIYDLERSPRDYSPQPVSDGCCPSLLFESRFESGNLRQARRIGQFEYELVLKTDLYTARHTQWYFFRVHNAQPNVTYKFKIVNLLKSSSLYNFGMRPLMYSENDAAEKKIGWVRVGHHINYTRNTANNSCPLLLRSFTYYMLEWQMEFPNADDTYYLAHCYPYTFTDLKDDLDVLMASPEHKACVKREVLCETRAGNSCFLLTVTNFENPGAKKAVIVSARVHPGESQSSWMMKGLLEFITGPDPVAQELRDKFVFKMVPMLNPDGVIVGNYRCSLAGRDLNRNYRHPRRENFPTIFHVKAMVEEVAQNHEILLYCDLHGHSRKHNVFMYGNNTSDDDVMGVGAAQAFVNERLFPWLLSAKCPDKFSFRSCKFQIRKCKESTGRVVMWRQMNIFNSFTLEATFSGTILNKENCRHFNIKDLMEIGRNLAQAVLDYHKVQENKVYHTEMVLDLTKSITQQVLETQGLIPSDMILPDFSVERARMEKEADVVQKDAEKWMGAMLELLHQPLPSLVPVTNALDDRGRGRDDKSRKMAPPSKLTKEEASKLLDQASLGTVDGCLKILSALNVREALQESDSSDSDSESEPEMKPSEAKTRKKKRKSRKQRDKDLYDKKQADVDKRGDYTEKEKYVRGKSFSALPALLCAEAPPTCPSGHTLSGNSLSDSFLTSAQMAKKQAGSSSVLERLNRERRTSQFQSKYEGRHNGGVPCFTEERSMERAAKRLAEMKKKCDEDKNRDLAFYYVDDQGFSQFPPHMYPYVLKQDDFNHRLHVALSEGTSNLSRSLMSMNIRTSYTHADNLQDLHPSINGNSFHFLTQACNLHGNVQPGHNHLSQSSNSGPTVSGCNLHTSTANATMPVVGNNQDNSQNSCSEDSSDSTGDGLKMQSLMALSARRTPYYSDLVRRSSTLATWPVHASRVQNNHSVTPPGLVAKRIVRYKAGHVPGRSPPLRSFQPHSLSTAPTIITSTIQPISRDPLRNHDNHRQTPMVSQPAVDEREAHCERTHPGRGSLIHCLQTPNIRQGFIWE